MSLFSRWLDKLGLAARLGHEVVVRQTFVKGSYSLLDDNLEPNPVCTWFQDGMIGLGENPVPVGLFQATFLGHLPTEKSAS